MGIRGGRKGNVRTQGFWTSALVLSYALGGAAGCSLIFVTPPPDNAETLPMVAQVDCTSSKVAPILDSVGAGYQIFRTGFAIAADDAVYEDQPISRGADIGIGVGLTALFMASAIYGYKHTSECRKAKHFHLDRQRNAEANQPGASISPDPLEGLWSAAAVASQRPVLSRPDYQVPATRFAPTPPTLWQVSWNAPASW